MTDNPKVGISLQFDKIDKVWKFFCKQIDDYIKDEQGNILTLANVADIKEQKKRIESLYLKQRQ